VVVAAAGRRCECKGTCGRSHSRSGFRCDREHDRGGVRLVVAPHDRSTPLAVAAGLEADDLRAWCPDCHRLARRRHQEHADRTRRMQTPAPDALFDL
jgi:hypothetical protein